MTCREPDGRFRIRAHAGAGHTTRPVSALAAYALGGPAAALAPALLTLGLAVLFRERPRRLPSLPRRVTIPAHEEQ